MVYLNLHKAQTRWGMATTVQERTGVTLRYQGAMYKVVAHLVLLYVSNSWVVTGEMIKVLMGFHHWALRQIMGMTEKCGAGGE